MFVVICQYRGHSWCLRKASLKRMQFFGLLWFSPSPFSNQQNGLAERNAARRGPRPCQPSHVEQLPNQPSHSNFLKGHSHDLMNSSILSLKKAIHRKDSTLTHQEITFHERVQQIIWAGPQSLCREQACWATLKETIWPSFPRQSNPMLSTHVAVSAALFFLLVEVLAVLRSQHKALLLPEATSDCPGPTSCHASPCRSARLYCMCAVMSSDSSNGHA